MTQKGVDSNNLTQLLFILDNANKRQLFLILKDIVTRIEKWD